MSRKRRYVFALLCLIFLFFSAVAAWVEWGAWPEPVQAEVFPDADAIVILGGGDRARWQHGFEVAKAHSELPLIVTGDDGIIVGDLTAKGIPMEKILHETAATSTVENAKFTKQLLDQLGARRVILVTNWFHAPRALSIFQKYQSDREFVVSFPPKPEPLKKWDRGTAKRERLAAIHNLLVHGVWSW